MATENPDSKEPDAQLYPGFPHQGTLEFISGENHLFRIQDYHAKSKRALTGDELPDDTDWYDSQGAIDLCIRYQATQCTHAILPQAIDRFWRSFKYQLGTDDLCAAILAAFITTSRVHCITSACKFLRSCHQNGWSQRALIPYARPRDTAGRTPEEVEQVSSKWIVRLTAGIERARNGIDDGHVQGGSTGKEFWLYVAWGFFEGST